VTYHDVLPKETKILFPENTELRLQNWKKHNPEIVSGLAIGYRLIIKGCRNLLKTLRKVESKKIQSKLGVNRCYLHSLWSSAQRNSL
jgi:hypothetical protein